MSLVARVLEENGIPTVIIGSARDIVEHVGVPRFLFVDFPLGNPCGKPWDRKMQQAVLAQAMDLFAHAETSRTSIEAPYSWDEQSWRDEYMTILPQDRERLLKKGAEMRERRSVLRARKADQNDA